MTTRNRDIDKALWDKRYCDASFYEIPWGRQLIGTKYIKCAKCDSNLLYQKDRTNSDPTEIAGKCLDCQTEFNADQTLEMILDAEFGDSAMSYCRSCVRYAFICAYETCRCFACGLSLEEKLCIACGERLAWNSLWGSIELQANAGASRSADCRTRCIPIDTCDAT